MDLKASKLYNTCMSKIHSYCIQCLFPGAYQENGKYSNTKEILFANISLKKKKNPIKKHVLVCHEHRSNAQNQQLLQEYKD